ncbi:MAG: glycosyltransferase family 4 protein [Calditrichaeota bacterium]|nr:glycosyltransferase family 4 protein [Calditrichota bacterium]
MRVLIAVGQGGIYAGGAHQALFAIMGLKNLGIEVKAVWGPDEREGVKGLARLAAVCPDYEVLPLQHRPTGASLRAFRKILKDFDPDVVEVFKSGAQYHALFGGIGLNRHALLFYRGISRTMDYFQELKYRLNRVDAVVPNCRALERIILSTGRIAPDKVHLIYDEVDPVCSVPESVDTTGLRAELGIPEETFLVTHLGNYSPWRGQDVLIRAAMLLKEKGVGFHLLFCGGDTGQLTPFVADHGIGDITTLSPYRRDPARVLKISDLVVNSSIGNESLSGVLLNAQAMGIPCVASRMPGFDESVADDETGHLVPVGDPESLAKGIETFLLMPSDERRNWGERARSRSRLMFSSEARARQRIEVYERAIHHRRMQNR